MIRLLFRSVVRHGLIARRRALSAEESAASAVVFSPHFDDETLGCGGVLAQKGQAGADVTVVFVTDGKGAHTHLTPAEEIAALRHSEGAQAARVLGVTNNIVCLDTPERTVHERVNEVAERMACILEERCPRQVFIPHTRDPEIWSRDHAGTTRAARRALSAWGHEVDVWEYPVWYWYQWPWTGLRIQEREQLGQFLRLSSERSWGTEAGRVFTEVIDTRASEATKTKALDCYKTQMTRLVPGASWPTLQDVGGGSFLKCFFGGAEMFTCVRMSASAHER